MRNHGIAIASAIVILTTVFAGTPAFAKGLKPPAISSVVFSGTTGNYTATITGTNFGATPGGIPCTACLPEQLQVALLPSQPAMQSVNVTAWSDTSITVTHIAANAGDALRIAVYNQLAGNVSAWGGRVSKQKNVPQISTIVVSGTGSALTMTISGAGFGAAPSQVGQNTDSPFFLFTDFNASAPNTNGFPWNAGFCGAHDCNGVTIGYTSWTDTQIVVSGFGADFGGNFAVNPKDAFCVAVWPSSSTSQGTTGGTIKCKRIPK